jgi:hypothetical protein
MTAVPAGMGLRARSDWPGKSAAHDALIGISVPQVQREFPQPGPACRINTHHYNHRQSGDVTLVLNIKKQPSNSQLAQKRFPGRIPARSCR